jgi:hypothetical protein
MAAFGVQRDLIPVNAVIGFLKRDRRWPSPLYRLGYKLEMIEQPISVGSIGRVEVDVICLAHRKNHAVLWECKSGHSVDERQAKVYAAATAKDVQLTGNVTFSKPSSAGVEAAYCCLEEEAKKIIEALSRCAPTLPVVTLGAKALLATNRFRDSDLTSTFTEGVPLPPVEEVPRFLVANTHTPKANIAREILATLVSFLHKQSRKISLVQVLAETFPDWACMGTDLRRHLTAKAKEIITEACNFELREFARTSHPKNVAGELVIEFVIDVLGSDATSRTRLFQKLTRKAEGFVERTAENRPYEPTREPESLWLPGLEPE